jgi:protein-tyrosine phosphatase
MTTPSRLVPLSGTTNFRDLGGYVGHDGRLVQWRKLFRSDHLGALSPGDILSLSDIGLARVADFRGADERQQQACAMPGLTVHSLPIDPSVVQSMKAHLAKGRDLNAEDTVRLMAQTYRAFVHDHSHRFASLFALLLESDSPLVFHCTAGKDRTGFAAAMILLSLGVSRDVVMQDYLLTNAHYKMPDPGASDLPLEALQVLWRVQQAFLDASLQAVDTDFAGIQNYLVQQLHVGPREQERLAEMYLQA